MAKKEATQEPAEEQKAEQMPVAPENVDAENNESTDSLKFEDEIDLGDFSFAALKKEGDTFTGKFVRVWSDQNGDPVNGLEFKEHKTDRRVICPKHHGLVKFFVEHLPVEEFAKIKNMEKTVFQLTVIGRETISDSREVLNYRIRYAEEK